MIYTSLHSLLLAKSVDGEVTLSVALQGRDAPFTVRGYYVVRGDEHKRFNAYDAAHEHMLTLCKEHQ